MDESDDGGRTDVVKFLRELCAAGGPCIVKVFVASRPIIGLSGHSTRNQKVIRLQDVNYSDILRFTASSLDSPELEFSPDIVHLAAKYITENAQGVFVWVHLVRQELLEYATGGYTKNRIFDFLKSLPKELEGIYERILMRLEGGKEQNVEDGQKMLRFVLLTHRPLGLDELGQALAIGDNLDSGFSRSDESFEGDLMCGIEKRIIACAGNFLEIKARGDNGNYFYPSQLILSANRSVESSVVQVMHQTVREFFSSNGPTAQSKFRMNSNDAHTKISITCVRYLLLCASKAASIDQAAGSKPWNSEHFEAYALYLSERPFFNYALGFVKRHFQQCGQAAGDSELVSQLSKKLNETPTAYVLENWTPKAWGQRIIGCEQQDYSKDFRAKLLHTATRMGYPRVVEALLIGGAEVDARQAGNTPLMVAAESGSLAAARVLLDQKAQLEARDGSDQMALHLAAANGHGLVVELILDRGADMEAEGSNKQTALHLAAANGHGPVVELLLNKGADMEAKDRKSQTALHLAAGNGHKLVVGILIGRGSNMEAGDGEEQTALHLAAANGHNSVIIQLVERGADKAAKDVFGWGALHVAAWNGREATIQMLVQNLDADKEGRDWCGWTALHVAAMNGRNTAIQWLVGRLGADKGAEDIIGWTALHFVAALGLGETAQLLIQTLEVDRNARNKEGDMAQDLAKRW